MALDIKKIYSEKDLDLSRGDYVREIRSGPSPRTMVVDEVSEDHISLVELLVYLPSQPIVGRRFAKKDIIYLDNVGEYDGAIFIPKREETRYEPGTKEHDEILKLIDYNAIMKHDSQMRSGELE